MCNDANDSVFAAMGDLGWTLWTLWRTMDWHWQSWQRAKMKTGQKWGATLDWTAVTAKMSLPLNPIDTSATA